MKTTEKYRIRDIAVINYGSSLSEINRISGVVPVYGSNGIVGKHNKAITNGDTIIIGRKGSAGSLHFSAVSCYPIDTTYFIDEDSVKPVVRIKFLYYFLLKSSLPSMSESSAIPGINRDDIYDLVISVPSLSIQDSVNHVLDIKSQLVSDISFRLKQQQNALSSLQMAVLNEVFASYED